MQVGVLKCVTFFGGILAGKKFAVTSNKHQTWAERKRDKDCSLAPAWDKNWDGMGKPENCSDITRNIFILAHSDADFSSDPFLNQMVYEKAKSISELANDSYFRITHSEECNKDLACKVSSAVYPSEELLDEGDPFQTPFFKKLDRKAVLDHARSEAAFRCMFSRLPIGGFNDVVDVLICKTDTAKNLLRRFNQSEEEPFPEQPLVLVKLEIYQDGNCRSIIQ